MGPLSVSASSLLASANMKAFKSARALSADVDASALVDLNMAKVQTSIAATLIRTESELTEEILNILV